MVTWVSFAVLLLASITLHAFSGPSSSGDQSRRVTWQLPQLVVLLTTIQAPVLAAANAAEAAAREAAAAPGASTANAPPTPPPPPPEEARIAAAFAMAGLPPDAIITIPVRLPQRGKTELGRGWHTLPVPSSVLFRGNLLSS